jgi:hypothetical protein
MGGVSGDDGSERFAVWSRAGTGSASDAGPVAAENWRPLYPWSQQMGGVSGDDGSERFAAWSRAGTSSASDAGPVAAVNSGDDDAEGGRSIRHGQAAISATHATKFSVNCISSYSPSTRLD